MARKFEAELKRENNSEKNRQAKRRREKRVVRCIFLSPSVIRYLSSMSKESSCSFQASVKTLQAQGRVLVNFRGGHSFLMSHSLLPFPAAGSRFGISR